MEVVVGVRMGEWVVPPLFTGSWFFCCFLFFSFVTLLPAHCSWENWRSTRHWLAHDTNTQG